MHSRKRQGGVAMPLSPHICASEKLWNLQFRLKKKKKNVYLTITKTYVQLITKYNTELCL